MCSILSVCISIHIHIHFCFSSGHEKVAELLLLNGANVDDSDNDGWSALHQASNDGGTENLKFIVDFFS